MWLNGIFLEDRYNYIAKNPFKQLYPKLVNVEKLILGEGVYPTQ